MQSDEGTNHGALTSAVADIAGPRPTKACVECRRQKMKCEPTKHGPCKRCRNSNTECVFKPRANARQSNIALSAPSPSTTNAASPEVLERLAVIESILGISRNKHPPPATKHGHASRGSLYAFSTGSEYIDQNVRGLQLATFRLMQYSEPHQRHVWAPNVVFQLWRLFHTNMEGLHFQSGKEILERPTPLLLAAILYVSSLHHSTTFMTAMAPAYFHALCKAIAEISVPEAFHQLSNSEEDHSASSSRHVEHDAFQNVLGLILAGLTSEALIGLTGIWIAIGYRLVLDHCPVHTTPTANRWLQLFTGLQIIDLEHASLHLSCTVVPVHAPLPSLHRLQSFADDPFHRLTVMMHSGLSHFAGRGLPTIWAAITSSRSELAILAVPSFTEIDAQVVKGWARDLDDWLASSERLNTSNTYTRIQIRRQYNLHRLLVLSIYHPARGVDLFVRNTDSLQQHELLLSARATLAMRRVDTGIWANWDLVIITWAAIIVLQGMTTGPESQEDSRLVQFHVDKLRNTKRPEPSLHHFLANRVETWRQQTMIPPTTTLSQAGIDSSWSLFDQASMDVLSDTYNYFDGAVNRPHVQESPHSPPDFEGSMEGEQLNTGASESCDTYTTPAETWPFGLNRVFGHTSSNS